MIIKMTTEKRCINCLQLLPLKRDKRRKFCNSSCKSTHGQRTRGIRLQYNIMNNTAEVLKNVKFEEQIQSPLQKNDEIIYRTVRSPKLLCISGDSLFGLFLKRGDVVKITIQVIERVKNE